MGSGRVQVGSGASPLISDCADISTVLIIHKMLMSLVEILESSGVRVVDVDHEAGSRPEDGSGQPRIDAMIRFQLDGSQDRLLVETRTRAPYKGEIGGQRMPEAPTGLAGVPVLVAPFISESIGRALVEAGWSWVDQAGNCDIRSEGLRIVRRTSTKPRPPAKRSLPGGGGGLTIIRWLISECSEPVGASQLARIAGVTQPRASQCLADLVRLDLVRRLHRSAWEPDRAALWKAFLESYPGPGGTEQLKYSLESPLEAARMALSAVSRGDRIAFSADVGPDCLAPSRSSTHLVIYLSSTSDPFRRIWTEAEGRADANVIVRYPGDSTVFGFGLDVTVSGTTLPLAHPTQMAWDLLELGGDDRREAADELEEWTLNYREDT